MIKEYKFINLFRALAAFWVLIAHCMIWGGWYGLPVPNPKIAVDLFMMISGFLMAANAMARSQFEPLDDTRNWLKFYLRRFFRLAPVYYFALFMVVLLSDSFLGGYHELQQIYPERWANNGNYSPLNVEYSFTNIMLHVSFLFGLHPTYSASTFLPDWSLSLEMQFYIVFPLLITLLCRFGVLRMGIVIGFGAVVAAYFINKSVDFLEPSFILLKLQYFIAGIFLFYCLIDNSWYKKAGLLICASLLLIAEMKYGNKAILLPLLLFVMYGLGLMEALNKFPVVLNLVLNNRLVRFASELSYGVYLLHGFFISLFGLLLVEIPELMALSIQQRIIVMFLFVGILSYIASYIVYKVIELPGIKLGKKVIKSLPSGKKASLSGASVVQPTIEAK